MSKKLSIGLTTIAAFLMSLLILIAIILPAEFNLDPMGSGAALGLIGLSGSDSSANNSGIIYDAEGDAEDKWVTNTQHFRLSPFESIELKYRLKQNAGLIFNWNSTQELVFDFHAEPDGAPEGYSESFQTGRSLNEQGSYIAKFDGIHGWFLENRTMQEASVTLRAAGFSSEVYIFRGGHVDTQVLAE